MIRKFRRVISGALVFLMVHASAYAAVTDLASAPLVTSPSSSILPNLLFAFDDSGSMAWFHMPDDSSDAGSSVVWKYGWFGARSSQCNGMYYNPNIVYSPPVDATGASFANSNFTAAWEDGYNASGTTTNLGTGFAGIPSADSAIAADATVGAAYYYKYNGAQTTAQKNYNSSTSTFATECGSNRGSSSTQSEPSIPTGTLAGGGTGALWTKIFVSASSAITSFSRSATSGSCTVTVTTAAGGTTGMTGGMAITVAGISNNNFNGARTVLAVASSTQFTYTNSNCASSISGGGTVMFAVAPVSPGTVDERQNFANWYSYYRSRILMMKTSMGLAVKPITNQYRVGFLSMNQQSESLNVGTFDSTQKAAFYTLLYSKTVGSGTPLRTLLSQAGKYYAHKLTVSGFTTTDPVQYSCQQNFTILSTDGFWNTGNGSKLDGTTMDNEDGAEPRPFSDGSNNISTAVTPSVVTVRQSSAQNTTVTTPWVKTTTTVSSTKNCSAIPASSGRSSPPNTCLQDGSSGPNSISSQRTWCVGTVASPGNSNDCTGPYGTGNPQVYVCRGTSAAANVPDAPDNVGCQYDGSGQLYCLFNTTSSSNGCTAVYSGSPIRICRAAASAVPNSGYTVTSTPATYNEVQHVTTTTLQDVATTTNSTVTTTNGVSAPPVLTGGGSTTTVISASPNTTSDNGAPTGGSTYTNGSATNTCSATPPAPGTTAAVAGTPITVNNGTAIITPVSTSSPVVGTTTTTASSSGGTSNTLSDVAEYYYITDLRDASLSNCTGAPIPPATAGIDVCTNNVPVSGADTASTQHMTTFTLALGARGNMLYSPTYQTDKVGDFFDVKQGTTTNTAGGICSWQTSGACNWPTPSVDSGGNGALANIDDTWHAAVNGRGQYFSATDPATLTLGLTTALAGVKTRTGSSAAATTSNPNVTSGDNFVFSSTFTTTEWDGELVRQQLDLTTGAVSSTIDWTSQAQLDSNASRHIWTFDSTNASTKLKTFAYASLTGSEQGYFNTSNISSLSQFCAGGIAPCLAIASPFTAAAGANLVSFLAGDRTNEGALSDNTKYYRQRLHVLGDIVDAEAVYVKAPLLNFSDAGFSAFASTNSTRQGMVYVASNDGMLHAINATTGAESWAYVPTLLFPNLYKLADKNYSSNHQYYADGTPIVGDVYFSGAWHTILVAGLGGGGKGYYALDITDPANPKALWEFTDTNMGYTYGNPVISKLQDGTATNGSGTWAVFFTSGYNNNASGQDGQGHLYVVNAGTGAKIRDINTGAGDTTTPSGLARINAWVDNTSVDNTTLRVYGGDMLGNMWRFDVNNLYGTAGYDAQKLITVYANTAATTVQPITVKPELGLVNNTPIIYFGTGRFLGLTDLADTTQQSFYAIQDKLNSTTLVTPRSTSPASNFVQQVLTTTTCPANSPATICGVGQIVRTSTSTPVTFPTNNGWFMDLPDSGERDNTDPTLALGTIGFTTNVPSTNACTAGGTSFRYLLDYATGAPVATSTTHVSAVQLGSALATRAVFVRLPNNTVVQLTRMSDGTTLTTNVPISGSASTVRRISWRELITDQ